MASSQVEIASSSPFGCVLRDHNRRDGCRESNARATHAVFQENIKNFVRDHLNTCISISSDSAPNEKTQKPISNADTWVSRVAKNNLGNLSFTRRNHNIMDKDDSSLSALVSPRHSQILDRWAARQAREMVSLSTLENEVELLESFPSRSSSFTSRREEYPPRSDGSSEISNLGASSLVQIWEKRLNQSNSTKPNAPASPKGSSPNASCNENAFSVEEQCRVSEAGESTDEPQGNEEPFPDWESSDQSYSCSPRWQSSDAAENERGRVADIIKRLTATNHMQSPLSLSDDNDHELCSSTVTGSSPYRERDRASAPEQQQPEHRAFAQVTSSPRIRGRRAFNDLLMQLERDRHGEINNLAERGVVSKFTQRGRIQSLLRLRLLQRGVAAYDQSHQKSAAPHEVNRQSQGSAIMQLRERFSTGVEQRTSTLAEVSEPRNCPHREIVSNTTQLDNSPTPNQLSKDTRFQTVYGTGIHCTEPTQNSLSQTSADNKEEARPSSDVTFQRTCSEAQNDNSKETVEATSSIADSNANEMVDKVEASDQQYATAETSYDEMVEEEVTSDQQYAESSYDEIEEEVEASDQNYDEASYDWISHISRPRSYWEERRQEWYREILDTGSDKEEIRKLLERRTVSTFLSSDFRERMDRLMKSHMGTQTQLVSTQDDEEDNQGGMDQLMAFLQDRLHSGGSPREDDGIERVEEEEERRNEEEEEEEEKAEEQEEESIISGSDHELIDYSNQSSSSIHTPSHSLLRTWSFRDNEAGDDSDRVAFISSPPPSQSQSFYQDSRQDSSSINHHSIEMELIYDLRGHMEQLFHEMSELRKSIKSCMDMQMQLQQSKNQEVPTVKEEEKKFHDRTPKKGNCCICYEKKINSLLYRCGHMCACLKCSNELQWNSGKCPICRAPIVDVVRVYADT